MRVTDPANATTSRPEDRQHRNREKVAEPARGLSPFVRHSIACYLAVAFIWFFSLYPFTPRHVLQQVKGVDCGMLIGYAMAPVLLPIAVVVLAILAIVSPDFRHWWLWVAIAIYFVAVFGQQFARRFTRPAP